PVVTSADVKVRVASHVSNVPWTGTEALTANVIAPAGPVTTNTGTSCAGLTNGSANDARRQRMMSLMRLTPDRPRSVVKSRASDADVSGSQKWKLTATKGPFKETFSVSRFPCRSMSMYRHPRIADAGREKRHSSPPRRLYVSLV